MAQLNPKEEIISFLRGFFVCSLISSLGKKGILDKMLDGEFSMDQFEKIKNKNILKVIITYFQSIGLLESNAGKDKFSVTENGSKIFKRYGSFCLLHSYGKLVDSLENVLFDKNDGNIAKVDRVENVLGSGKTNEKKYFSHAIEMLKEGKSPGKIFDIGCGNGAFLKLVLGNFPGCRTIGVDISPEALEETRKNLQEGFYPSRVKTILSNGYDIANWLLNAESGDDSKSDLTVITMWFFIHEISNKDINRVIDLFNEIYRIRPLAEIVMGEITDVPVETLSKNKYESIMPEFLLFHEVSRQGVLSWDDYQKILKRIPYSVKHEKLFDVLKSDEKSIPSSFIWHLVPKGGICT